MAFGAKKGVKKLRKRLIKVLYFNNFI